MIIVKKLLLPGATEVTAVMLNDEGEEYPVFLESLHNTIIFPTLMESGYGIVSLPYGFVKDGVHFDQLPTVEYTPTDAETEQMYNAIGVKMSYDEIKSHLDVTEVVGLSTPPTQYTITTREEFLEFLRLTEATDLEDDYMPLNYFVAPDARFTMNEYRASENLQYVQAIEHRRDMSLKKFHLLVKRLQSMDLLGATPTPHEVLDAYFAWGVDGLQFTVINRHKEKSPFRLRNNRNINAPIVRKTQGFVDGAGNLLTPANERDVVWQLASKEPEYLQSITQGLGMNDTVVQEFRCNATQDLTILEGTTFNVRYTVDALVFQANMYCSLRVKSPVEIGSYIDMSLALPHNIEKLHEYCSLQALARYLYDMRKPRVKTSSYDVLKIIGANPLTAINYILTKYDLNKERKLAMSEDEVPNIPAYEVEDYVAGKEVLDSSKALMDDIVDGIFCIDNIGRAKSAEALVSPDTVFKALYAVHNVMGISLNDIYEKIKSITPDDKFIVFSNGSYQHKIDVSPMKMSINGYLNDVQNYDVQCADDCTFFTYVTMVAREVGVETCTRHVGIEFFMVNRNTKAVKELLDKLVSRYEDKVNSTIVDAQQRAKALRMKNVFALSRYFEIALKGTITWSKLLGSGVEYATAEEMQVARAYMETKIESLPTYCGFTTNSFTAATLSFNAYCTNAYCTPEYIIPRGKTPIREVPFYSAWMDLNVTNPPAYAQLIELGVLPPNFIPWSSRYMQQQFKQRSLEDFDAQDSLLHYYEFAVNEVKNWLPTIDFHHVKHPIEYMFPGIYGEEEEEIPLKIPRSGEPVVRFGVKRDITLEDYRDKLYPTEAIVEPDQYIRPYRGFSAEAFMLAGTDIFNRIPEIKDAGLTVFTGTDSVYVTDTQQIIHFTRLGELDTNKYPIMHVCGRTYLLRATDGKLWEVRI